MQELHEMSGYPRKVQKLWRAAQLIWDKREVTGLREAMPSALRAARSVADVLIRRTRLGLLDARALCADGADGPERVARAMAPELGWDEARISSEVDDWNEVARAEGFVPGASGGRREAAVA